MNSQSAVAWNRSDAVRPNSALEQAIAGAFRAHGKSHRTLSMSMAAPVAPAERLLRLTRSRYQVLWSPSVDNEHSGIGAAHVLIGNGEDRFALIRAAAERVFQETAVIALDAQSAPDPQVVGGFAFQPARGVSTLWRGFEDAQFVLPRIAYTRRARCAWLTLTATARDLSNAAGRSRLAGEASQALQALRGGFNGTLSALGVLQRIDPAEGVWSALVSGIRSEIAAGLLEKAVVAQRTMVRGARLPPAALVLERLRAESPDCARFALSVGNRTFLGASPERLVKRSGNRLWTEAVAGSIRSDDPTHGQSLLLSKKDGLEHAIVAREIGAVLGPLCETLTACGPQLHRLPHVTHLRTRFQGLLKQPRHVLDLVERLHPTPAVGGAPRGAALAWLARYEGVDRGLYAGPFGAFDRSGDGEFVVAIRSGLLSAGEAHLFAGAGIVEGSNAQSELCETRWKLRSLMAALGVDPRT
jgi:isochorismate synthase